MRRKRVAYKLALALLVAASSVSTASFAPALTTEVCAEETKEANPVTDFEWETYSDYAVLKNYIGDKDVTEIVVPDKYNGLPVTGIGAYAFDYTNYLETIVMPDSVEIIGDKAFLSCGKLKNVVLSENLSDLGNYTFSDCIRLESISLPDELLVLKRGVFDRCDSLSDVKLPSNLKEMEKNVFSDCVKLKEINLPESLISIDSAVFSGCTSLKSIIIPSKITEISSFTFSGCSSLEKVVLNDNIKGIRGQAFENCYNLKTLLIPKSVTDIYGGVVSSFLGIEDSITLRVYNNSYALERAKELGCKYEIIDIEEENSSDTTKVQTVENGWHEVDGKSYWYENSIKQGTLEDANGVLGDGTVRGREIYDPVSDGWYWLDAVYDGAKAVSKEVWMPYIYQGEQNWGEEELRNNANASGNMAAQVEKAIKEKTGKWVRYNADGKMYKGWYTVEGADAEIYPNQVGNTYYYDPMTGLMAKGEVEIDGQTYYFDETTGVKQW